MATVTDESLEAQIRALEAQIEVLKAQVRLQKVEGPPVTFAELRGVLADAGSSSEE